MLHYLQVLTTNSDQLLTQLFLQFSPDSQCLTYMLIHNSDTDHDAVIKHLPSIKGLPGIKDGPVRSRDMKRSLLDCSRPTSAYPEV